MSEMNQPATPDNGTNILPMPDVSDNMPAQPGEGPLESPTPALPDDGQSAQPGEGPAGLPTPSLPSQPLPQRPVVRRCPTGYRQGTVQNNQGFTDLLLENNVSYNAMRAANPNLPTTRLSPGTVYCAPPSGSRRVCAYGSRSYVMSQGETLYTLVRTLGISAGRLLQANPSLAPGDFLPGRVICLP